MPPRIPKTAEALVTMLRMIALAIAAEPFWPITGPGILAINALADAIEAAFLKVKASESQLSIDRGALRDLIEDARAIVKKVDDILTGIYSESDPKKTAFGLSPTGKDAPGNVGPKAMVKILTIKLVDWNEPGSLLADWASVEDAHHYEIEWSTVETFATVVGRGSSSASDFRVKGLTPGSAYWVRVRAVNGDDYGPWTDPESRFAPK